MFANPNFQIPNPKIFGALDEGSTIITTLDVDSKSNIVAGGTSNDYTFHGLTLYNKGEKYPFILYIENVYSSLKWQVTYAEQGGEVVDIAFKQNDAS